MSNLTEKLQELTSKITPEFIEEEVIKKSLPPTRTIKLVEGTVIGTCTLSWLLMDGGFSTVVASILGCAGANQLLNRKNSKQTKEE